MSKRTIILLVSALAVVLAAAAALAFLLFGQLRTDADAVIKTENITGQPDEASSVSSGFHRVIEKDGVTWKYNSRLRTVLFLGIDTDPGNVETDLAGTGGRSDTMILFIVDPDAETIRMMPISRDTITEIGIYDTDRSFVVNAEMQITMQYAFGSSPAHSCQLSKRAVSAMLHGLPISSYCSLTIGGIGAAAELLGGITVRLEEDWTDIDPAYTAGSTVTLDGVGLERFLRYRDTGAFGSNNDRMRRQSRFVMQLFRQLGRAGSVGTDAMLEYLDDYLETDMDGDMIQQLTSYQLLDEIISLPGSNAEGTYHDEFYIDDEALNGLLLEVFYQKQN